MTQAPQYLCIGHCCHDRTPNGNVLGGTASYSALVARNLGLETAILTSTGPDFEFGQVFSDQGIAVAVKAAERTTVFENIYHEGARTQYLHARAATLFPSDVPEPWHRAAIVQFCPIAAEVDFALLRAFPDAVKGATIQGWLRHWNAAGLVSSRAMDWRQLAGLDIVIMSDADIAGFEAHIPDIAAAVPVLVMTQGARGAVVYHAGRQSHFPAFPVREVDATGAGDVFATSFMLRYAQTRDIAAATVHAHVAASFVVEGAGISNLATAEMIARREEEYRRVKSLSENLLRL